MKKLFFGLSALVTIVGCNKSPEQAVKAAAESSVASIQDGWQAYEDDWIRIRYPQNTDIGGAEAGKQNPAAPTFAAVPKTNNGDVAGAFTLQLDPKTKGMLLRDAIQSEVTSRINPRGVVLAAPREVKVGNGKCLSAVVTTPSEHCAKGTGSCHIPFYLTLCDGPDGRRYTATTMLSTSQNPNALSPQAQQQAATYERILRSLEFKKS